MKTKTNTKLKTTATRSLAPEDVKQGDYIAVSHTIGQFVSACSEWNKTMEIARLRYVPCDAGDPLQVEAICLPFILVRDPDDDHQTIDLRLQDIVKLDKAFGKLAFKKMDTRSTYDLKEAKNKKALLKKYAKKRKR